LAGKNEPGGWGWGCGKVEQGGKTPRLRWGKGKRKEKDQGKKSLPKGGDALPDAAAAKKRVGMGGKPGMGKTRSGAGRESTGGQCLTKNVRAKGKRPK